MPVPQQRYRPGIRPGGLPAICLPLTRGCAATAHLGILTAVCQRLHVASHESRIAVPEYFLGAAQREIVFTKRWTAVSVDGLLVLSKMKWKRPVWGTAASKLDPGELSTFTKPV